MAYSQRYNPDALPAHAEPEQAAQMLSRDNGSRREQSSRHNSRSERDRDRDRDRDRGSYANRPPPPIPAQASRRDDDRYRQSSGYQSPMRENSYEGSRRTQASPRNNSYNYDERSRQGSYSSSEKRFEPPGAFPEGSSAYEKAPVVEETDPLRKFFNTVDLSGQLSEPELGRALVNGDYTSFDSHTVRMMIRMFDVDRSGTISFEEFRGLWGFLGEWRKLFDRFDEDRSGTISFNEFKIALDAFGYTLTDEYVLALFKTYDTRRRGVLSFDLFVQACISLKRMTDVFKKYDTDRDGYIHISFQEFLMGAHSLFLHDSISPATDRGVH